MEIIFQFNEHSAGNLNPLSSQQEIGKWFEVSCI